MPSIVDPANDSKSDAPAGMKPGDIVLVDLEHGSMIGTALIVGAIYVYVADGNGTCEWYSRSGVSEYVEPEDPESNADPHDDDQFWTVTVEIPRAATDADVNRIFDAVADAAFDAQPEDRGWDVFIHGRGPRPASFKRLAGGY